MQNPIVGDFRLGSIHVSWAACSRPGARTSNDDRWRVFVDVPGQKAVFVMADGLGGQDAGDRAAEIAVDAVGRHASAGLTGLDEPGARAYACIQAASAALRQLRTLPGAEEADTSLTMLLLTPTECVWGGLGDTRLYRIDAHRLRQLSRDHSVAALMREGLPASASDVRGDPDRNRLVRTLASTPIPADVQGHEALTPGARFLLATDGWWEPLSDLTLVQSARQSTSVAQWVRRQATLIHDVNDPGQDNYSALAIEFGVRPSVLPSPNEQREAP